MLQKMRPVHWGIFIFLTLMWGSAYLLMKKAVVGLEPIHIAAWRTFSAGLVLLPIAIRRIHRINRSKLPYMLAFAFLGSAFPSLLYAISLKHVPTVYAGILNALTPACIILVGMLIYKVKYPRHQVIGLLIGFIGAAFLILLRQKGFSPGTQIFYVILILIATLMYGTANQILVHHLKEESALNITAFGFLMLMPLSLVLFAMTGFVQQFEVNQYAWPCLGYASILGVLGTGISLVLYNKLVKEVGVVFSSTITYFAPIITLAWGVYDGEHVGWGHLVALAVILAGTAMVSGKR
jgi:drug/metabolite transporter (DMT)-like permease